MPKPLVVQLAGVDIPLDLEKVERTDLYGSIEIETLDAQGRPCVAGTLADDGRTLLGPSSTAFGMLSPEGKWVEKKSLIPTDVQGRAIESVPSSYAAPVPLGTHVSVDEYLSHSIRAVYRLASQADMEPLLAELRKGIILGFPYSFRGGLEADAAFLLLAADGTPFMAIGTPSSMDFVGLDHAGALTEEEAEGEGEDAGLDFGMM
jgi:hypothetical protein